MYVLSGFFFSFNRSSLYIELGYYLALLLAPFLEEVVAISIAKRNPEGHLNFQSASFADLWFSLRLCGEHVVDSMRSFSNF